MAGAVALNVMLLASSPGGRNCGPTAAKAMVDELAVNCKAQHGMTGKRLAGTRRLTARAVMALATNRNLHRNRNATDRLRVFQGWESTHETQARARAAQPQSRDGGVEDHLRSLHCQRTVGDRMDLVRAAERSPATHDAGRREPRRNQSRLCTDATGQALAWAPPRCPQASRRMVLRRASGATRQTPARTVSYLGAPDRGAAGMGARQGG